MDEPDENCEVQQHRPAAGKTPLRCLRITDSLWTEVGLEAAKRGMSRSRWIRSLIIDSLSGPLAATGAAAGESNGGS